MNSMFFLLVPLLWCVLLMDFYKALSQFHPTVCSTPLLDPLYISVLLRCLAPCILIHLFLCLPSLHHHVENMISHPFLFLYIFGFRYCLFSTLFKVSSKALHSSSIFLFQMFAISQTFSKLSIEIHFLNYDLHAANTAS